MIRLFIIAICAVVVVVVGIVVWNANTEPRAQAPAAGAAPERQHFDLEGGQEMRPRWGRNDGGADGTSGN